MVLIQVCNYLYCYLTLQFFIKKLGSGWKQIFSFIFPNNENNWFPQIQIPEVYSKTWIIRKRIPYGLEFDFKVHTMQNGRKPQSLPKVDQSFCINLSVDIFNSQKFITFKYVTKDKKRYNIHDAGM